jgi:hypothetical protein
LGKQKKRVRSVSDVENETNPLQCFSKYLVCTPEGVQHSERQPEDQGEAADQPADYGIEATTPTVPEIPYPWGTSQRLILRKPKGKPTRIHKRR